jgi:RimK family alpha-L-glutamate ligase
MRIALVCRRPSPTTLALADVRVGGLELAVMSPVEAASRLGPGDAALGRLDVRPTLDGVEDGLWALGVAAARGATVLNTPGTLLATHDKLLTARILRRAGLPHPLTRHLHEARPPVELPPPVVLKPRHGSWGRHVTLCETEGELAAALDAVRDEPWFREHGALVQEVVPPTGSDLRIVVAGGRMVGAIRRVAAPGEWRTNVALGAERVPVDPPLAAIRLALDAADATSAALAGVDLVPTPDGGFTILEVNGAVDFTHEYRADGDIYRETVLELARAVRNPAAIRPPSEDQVLI